MKRLGPQIVIAIVLTSACAATDPRADTVAFPLQATQRNAGEIGQAVVAPQGDKTAMMVTLSGVPPWVARPVRLHTFVYRGSCASHESTAAYALNDVTQPSLASPRGASGPLTMHKTVPLSMDELRSTDYALVVRTSPADGNEDLFCGDLK